MTDRDATYVDLSGRVTPETMRRLKAYHADRIRRGDTPIHFTASVREVIDAGLDVIERAGDTTDMTSHNSEAA